MIYDVIIIGAGAAGIMTSITARQKPLRVLLLDGQAKIGAKILMSGGTRCNVTNESVTEKDFNTGTEDNRQLNRVRHLLRGFDNAQAIAFFKGLGVDLVLEPTGKYFPTTHSGKTVLDALLAECRRRGVEIQIERKVFAVDCDKETFTLQGKGFSFQTKCVVLTTGGLSYPATGSDGTGFRIAQSFGHHIVETIPALTPLTTSDEDLKSLKGISLPVLLTLFAGGKKQIVYQDSFLFTHLGFSGPVVLDISRHWLRARGQDPQIFVNFIPSHTPESFEQFLLQCHDRHPKKMLRTILIDIFPERLAEVILRKAAVAGDILLNQLKKEHRKTIAGLCTHYPLAVSGAVGYSKAEVTAGGVDLSQVNAKTLESVLQPGLFFAGEILDVDGRIGGFNFQWAWATGYAVGTELCNRMDLRKDEHAEENH